MFIVGSDTTLATALHEVPEYTCTLAQQPHFELARLDVVVQHIGLAETLTDSPVQFYFR